MKEVRRVRYRCDFCRKMTGTRDSMERHESICTNNPKRKCRMCRLAHEAYECKDEPKTISELKEIFEKDGFSEMREAAVDCPACILAVLRQTYNSWASNEYEDGRLEWNYKKSHKNLMECLSDDDTETNRKVKEISDFFGGNMVMISVMRKLFEAEPNLPVPSLYRTSRNKFEATWANKTTGLSFDNEDSDTGCFFYTYQSIAKYQELDESLSIDSWVYDKLRLFTVKEEK